MSTVGPSHALTSRVTPRSPKKWSPKSYTTGPTKRSSRAKFDNSPSDPLYRSPAYVPNASPRALIDRLSPTSTNRVHSPPKLLDRLIRSDTMITSGNDVPMQGVIESDVNNLSSRSASNNVDMVHLLCLDLLSPILYKWLALDRRKFPSHPARNRSRYSARNLPTHLTDIIDVRCSRRRDITCGPRFRPS